MRDHVGPSVRRIRILWLDPSMIANLVLGMDGNDCIEVAKPINLPSDVRVHGVHYAPERDQFGIALESEAFDPVPLGQVASEIILTYQTVRLPKSGYSRGGE